MNKISNIYSIIITKENLYRSAYAASRGRRYRDTTADFSFRLEEEVEKLHRELTDKTYRHGKYRMFTIHDPKERSIAAAPFRDRVVHHAVHDVIEPLFDKTFIYDSYACRINKGTHKAVDRAQSFLRANRFCLHGDIKKYFPSIDHGVLKSIIRQRIEDEDLLWLLDEIIDSAKNIVASGENTNHSTGLPIGNLTSQFFANLYLNELDSFVKFNLKRRYYIRYMDDFLIFGDDKEELRAVKDRVRQFLSGKLNLTLHEGKSQIYRTGNGIKFLGFRIFRDYRRLAADNVRRFRKRLGKFSDQWRGISGEENPFTNHSSLVTHHCNSVRCWVAHAKYADTGKLRLNIWSCLKEKNEPFANLLKDILPEGITDFSARA